jgi:hypothetical protein
VILGLILALASAVATNLAFLFKHRGAVRPADPGPPSAAQRGRSVPLQMVRGRLGRGDRGLVSARRCAVTRAALDRAAPAPTTRSASLAALIAVEGAIFASGAALVRISARRHVQPRAEGLILGAAAGALFGVSAVAIKYITQASPGPLLGLVSPWTLTAMIAGVIGFYASARSLQIGNGVEVIAITSVVANLAAIFGGIIVFHDGSGPAGIAARFVAFCLVIAGAALMPAPMRATSDAASAAVQPTSGSAAGSG